MVLRGESGMGRDESRRVVLMSTGGREMGGYESG